MMACTENKNIEYTLNRDIMDILLPGDNTILEKGNRNHTVQLNAVEDCARMLNILTIDQKSAIMTNGIVTMKDYGRS